MSRKVLNNMSGQFLNVQANIPFELMDNLGNTFSFPIGFYQFACYDAFSTGGKIEITDSPDIVYNFSSFDLRGSMDTQAVIMSDITEVLRNKDTSVYLNYSSREISCTEYWFTFLRSSQRDTKVSFRVKFLATMYQKDESSDPTTCNIQLFNSAFTALSITDQALFVRIANDEYTETNTRSDAFSMNVSTGVCKLYEITPVEGGAYATKYFEVDVYCKYATINPNSIGVKIYVNQDEDTSTRSYINVIDVSLI